MMNLSFNNIDGFREYINTNKYTDFALDVSNMNIFESLKFIALSSAYFYQKYPKNKLKCIVKSEDIKSLSSSFEIGNLEFV